MLQDGTRIQLELFPTLQIDKIAMGKTVLKYERDGGTFYVDFPKTLRTGRTYSIDVHYSGNPTETGRFGCFTFKKDTSGHPWINTACEGDGAYVWWPNKEQWRDEPQEGMLDHGRCAEWPDGCFERKVHGQEGSRRRLHALGLAGALPDQQLRRRAEHRQLCSLRRQVSGSATRLLRAAGGYGGGEAAVRAGAGDDEGLLPLSRRISVQEGWVQVGRGAVLRAWSTRARWLMATTLPTAI